MDNLNEIKLEILKTKVLYTEISMNLSKILKKQQFDLATEYKSQKEALNNKLDNLKNELIKKCNDLELNSKNAPILFEISNVLLEFQNKDDQFLQKINSKIEEISSKKEVATKNQDFNLANEYREEIKLLQEFLSKSK